MESSNDFNIKEHRGKALKSFRSAFKTASDDLGPDGSVSPLVSQLSGMILARIHSICGEAPWGRLKFTYDFFPVHCDSINYRQIYLDVRNGVDLPTNADLELWAGVDRAMSESVDFWTMYMGHPINRELAARRRWRVYKYYKKRGGLKRDQVELLSRLRLESSLPRGDCSSFHADGKRPFGSSALSDIFEVTGRKPRYDGMEESAWLLFDSLPFALADLCHSRLAES